VAPCVKVQLDDDLFDRMDRRAVSLGITRAGLIRDALRRYFGHPASDDVRVEMARTWLAETLGSSDWELSLARRLGAAEATVEMLLTVIEHSSVPATTDHKEDT
jgi:predicted transcriptional regulator